MPFPVTEFGGTRFQQPIPVPEITRLPGVSGQRHTIGVQTVLTQQPLLLGAAPLPDHGRESHHNRQNHGSHQARHQRPAADALERAFDQAHGPRQDGLSAQKPSEIGGQFQSGLVPLPRIFAQAFQANRLDIPGHGRIDLPQLRRLTLRDLLQGGRQRRGLKWRMSGQCGIQNRAQRVDIGRRAGLSRVAGRLFRSHVAGRPQNLPGHRQLGIRLGSLGQSEIRDPRPQLSRRHTDAGIGLAVDLGIDVGFRRCNRIVRDTGCRFQ